jgi:hypothetical protein
MLCLSELYLRVTPTYLFSQIAEFQKTLIPKFGNITMNTNYNANAATFEVGAAVTTINLCIMMHGNACLMNVQL